MVNRNVKKRMMKEREHIRIVRSSRGKIRKIRVMRITRKKGAGALRPIDIMDHNIPSSLNRAFKPQITVIRARKIPRPRTRIDRLIDEKTDMGFFNSWVK
jgi:hypothetical protein